MENKSLYLYITHFESDSDKTWQVGSTNESLSKRMLLHEKVGYHGNTSETWLP